MESWKNSYFKNVPSIGNLHLTEVIYEWELEPIIFFCKDDNEEEYYCHTIDDRYVTDWVIYRVSKELKEQLLTNQISIREGFRRASKIFYINSRGIKTEILYENIKEFLPKDDIYVKE